ncbi:MAG: chromate efflux transporter [Nitrospirae bacterium]|nr:chromate efflux transporter [Nitrospirota bacterium]
MITPSLKELSLAFLRLGLTAFGGPAMVAHIKEVSVNKKVWLDEETFDNGVALCQSIPGATAMQTSAYVGLKARGVIGALISYVSFGLPAFILMVILSAAYMKYHDLSRVISILSGLKVIVIAIILSAVYYFGRGLFKDYRTVLIAVLSALLFGFGVNPFIVIAGAGVLGSIVLENRQENSTPYISLPFKGRARVGMGFLILTLIFFFLAVLYFFDPNLFRLAAIMLRIDLFAFGGGFASLPLMLHEVVNVRGWMDSKTFMDGIALGQVTPGPIVITAAFVGYLLYGLSGAIVSTIAILSPSFLILIISAPYFDRVNNSLYFKGAVTGVLSSFVGLLIYLAINFSLVIQWDIERILLGTAVLTALLLKIDILYVILAGGIISLVLF